MKTYGSLFLVYFLFSITSLCGHHHDLFHCFRFSDDDGTQNGVGIISFTAGGDEPLDLTMKVYSGVVPNSQNLVASFEYSIDGSFRHRHEFVSSLSAGIYLVTAEHSGTNRTCFFQIYREGCTDSNALNYDPEAIIDNGSCIYPGNTCPAILSVSGVLPDCGEANGSIDISSGGGTGLLYSIDGGTTYHPGGYFDGLSAGAYSIVVRKSGCSNATRDYVLSCDQNTVCPEITNVRIVNQPSACGVADGTITVLSTGSNKEFSIDGGHSWKTLPTFAGLATGSYTTHVRNRVTHCGESSSVTLVCTPSCSDGRQNGTETGPDCGGSCAPCCPEDITVDVQTYPYCDPGSTGSFMVRARGVNLQFSINGSSYQNSPVFSNITAGTYTIYVRSTSTRCVRTSSLDFVCAATCPDIASTEIEAPNCDTPESGLLTITLGPGQGNNPKATGGSDAATPVYEYSIDGGNTWSEHNSFAVSGGSYTVVVRNNETDCTVGDIVSIPCVGCFDGIKNGDETDVDCGGAYCHSCTCPSVADIKASEVQANSGSGGSTGGSTGDGGRGGVGGVGGGLGGGLGGQSGGDDSGTFICDLPEYYDCPNCISYRSCHDDLDNDGDELCDCEDGDCSTWYDEVCEKPKETCADGLDNDNDGMIDCHDQSCQGVAACGYDNSTAIISAKEIFTELLIDQSPSLLHQVLRYTGVPKWTETIDLENGASLVPLVKDFNRSVEGFVLTGRTSSGEPSVQVIDRDVLLEEPITSGSAREPLTNSITKGVAATFLTAFTQKLYNQNDNELDGYLAGFGVANACIYRCTFTVEVVQGPGNGGDLFGNQIKGWNYNENPENGAHWTRDYDIIVHTSCQTSCSDDGGGTTLVLKTTGGGSTSGGNTASEAFNDRIKACADGGGPGDAPIGGDEMTPDQAFCNAISQIINTCDRFSLGSVYNRSLLEDIAMIRECGDRDPETDDAGMLTEVAEFVCSQGPNDYTTNTVRDYVAYASMVGFDKAACLEEHITLDNFIKESGLNVSVVKFLSDFDFSMDDDDEKVNSCEARLIVKYPQCALEIYENRATAVNTTIEIYGVNRGDDCSDAFRHAFFNALNTYSCGSHIAEEFGDAHECELPDENLSKQMDLFNNRVGRIIATNYPQSEALDALLRIHARGNAKIIENGTLVSKSCKP